ncbi:PepSY-associated TM helix domain-containing protein [Corynebacterium sp. H130]|uniref:PepSY-associated TM helix domain-containing protein n=1 Tax=Corynebacterium sp. H130 TaxID=3133444 RepID=UPI0030B3A691
MTVLLKPTARRAALNQRQRARRLHVVAGVLIGPFIAVAALTGLLYAFAPSIENVIYHDVYTASPGEPQDVDKQIQRAWQEHPDLRLSGVQVEDGHTTRVLFHDPSQPSASYRRAVFVDPVDLQVKGDMVQYGSSAASPFRAWLSEGHKQLWLGAPGRFYSELAASWMGAIAIAGLVMVLRSRASSRKAAKWHRQLGLWLLPGMLFLTITGLTWSGVAGANIGDVRTQLDWKAPATQAKAVPAAQAMNASGVVKAARKEGLTGRIEAKPGAYVTDPWVVQESRQPYRLSMNSVVVNPVSEKVVERVPFSAWPLPAKLTEWLINLHMGFLFGIWSELALGALALGILLVTALGYAMWWQAFRRRRSWIPARSAWSWPFIAIMIGYAILAPLFGISVVAFLVADFLWSRFVKPTKQLATFEKSQG